MAYPQVIVDTAAVEDNARLVVDLCSRRGVSVIGVTKLTCASPEVARAMLRGGVRGLADSRLENLQRLRQAGIDALLTLLRLPMLSQVRDVVEISDVSLNSEPVTVTALGAAARARGRRHRVILMVDCGDLREGVWVGAGSFDHLRALARAAGRESHLEVEGVGTNLACYGGIAPSRENMALLLQAKGVVEDEIRRPVPVVSGGNSANLLALQAGDIPAGVNQLRVGEAILLGNETLHRQPLAGARSDAVLVQAEVIETKEKPSVPVGTICQDAFGEVPCFENRGHRTRAILALGRQDVDVKGLTPTDLKIEILGASSDHLIIDATGVGLSVGSTVTFLPNYSATLALFTSRYVSKVYT